MKNEIKYNTVEKLVIYALSAAVGGIVLIISLFIAASVCLAVDMSDNYSTLVSGICLGIGSMVSGFLSGKKIKSGGIINGGACGALLYFLVFLISLFISKSGFSAVSISHSAISLISSSIGGVISVNLSQKRKIF